MTDFHQWSRSLRKSKFRIELANVIQTIAKDKDNERRDAPSQSLGITGRDEIISQDIDVGASTARTGVGAVDSGLHLQQGLVNKVAATLISYVICVLVRGEITSRVFTTWQEQLPKLVREHRSRDGAAYDGSIVVTVSSHYLPNATHVVLSGTCAQEHLIEFTKPHKLLPNVQLVQPRWVIDSLKYRQFQSSSPGPHHTITSSSSSSSSSTSNTTDALHLHMWPIPAEYLWRERIPPESSSCSPAGISSSPTFNNIRFVKTTNGTNNSSNNNNNNNNALRTVSEAVAGETTSVAASTHTKATTGPGPLPNHNALITSKLDELQQIYKQKGDDWRQRAYKKASAMLKQLPITITDVNQLDGIKEVGKSIRDKIGEILLDGKLTKLEELKKDPKTVALMELTNVWGIGDKKAEELLCAGYSSVRDLRERGKHLLTPQQLVGLKHYEDFNTKIPRAEVEYIHGVVASHCKALYPHLNTVVCGSYRRGSAECGDVDVLIAPVTAGQVVPPGALSHLIFSLEECGFLTDHLSLPSSYRYMESQRRGEIKAGFSAKQNASKLASNYSSASTSASANHVASVQGPSAPASEGEHTAASSCDDSDNTNVEQEIGDKRLHSTSGMGSNVTVANTAAGETAAAAFKRTKPNNENEAAASIYTRVVTDHDVLLPRSDGSEVDGDDDDDDDYGTSTDNSSQEAVFAPSSTRSATASMQGNKSSSSSSRSGSNAKLTKKEQRSERKEGIGRRSYMGVCRLSIEGARHRRIDIKTYPFEMLPFALLYFSGPEHFNRAMRQHAKVNGYQLNDKGLFRININRAASTGTGYTRTGGGQKISVACNSEADVFAKLGMEYKEPWDRGVFEKPTTVPLL